MSNEQMSRLLRVARADQDPVSICHLNSKKWMEL